jgi:hypothetical protein
VQWRARPQQFPIRRPACNRASIERIEASDAGLPSRATTTVAASHEVIIELDAGHARQLNKRGYVIDRNGEIIK